jgi:heavy metal translocating P-type ATPase
MHQSPFLTPLIVFFCLIFSGLLQLFAPDTNFAIIILWIGIVFGSWKLVHDSWQSILHKSFALDYIAILAIATGIITQNYIVAAVIVLMMSGGNALEDYAQTKAKQSLTSLKNRLPNQAQIVRADGTTHTQAIENVPVGTVILVRKGEVVPLDGTLILPEATLDESSLTGESMPVSKSQGEIIRSGSLNTGDVIKLHTIVKAQDSTYQQIVKLVEEAEGVKTPFVQLADKLSGWFTLLTLIMAALAYIVSDELTRSLAVLVIATPCPLILATPIALVGGMNAAARQGVIFKRLASLETLADVHTLIFDKTGTLTLGKPQLDSLTIVDRNYSRSEVLKIAASIERNSLHPFALAIVDEAQKEDLKLFPVESIEEKIGVGLSGIIEKKRYSLSGDTKHPDSQVVLHSNHKTIAVFRFLDTVKKSTKTVLATLQKQGLELHVFTGDSPNRTASFMEKLGLPIAYRAALSPADKRDEIVRLKQKAKVAMIGDGINDAPALAIADVGMAFSHQQHTAASEAADVTFLGNNIKAVPISIALSRHTMVIAKQSMYVGMGLSLLGMVFALFGMITPLFGALTQEFIDVAVILNALRAAFWTEKKLK